MFRERTPLLSAKAGKRINCRTANEVPFKFQDEQLKELGLRSLSKYPFIHRKNGWWHVSRVVVLAKPSRRPNHARRDRGPCLTLSHNSWS